MPFYRIYFNRKAEQTQVWSIDEGRQSTETNVIGAVVHPGVRCVTYWDPDTNPNPDTPSAWLKVYDAVLTIEQGMANFHPDPEAVLARMSGSGETRLCELP